MTFKHRHAKLATHLSEFEIKQGVNISDTKEWETKFNEFLQPLYTVINDPWNIGYEPKEGDILLHPYHYPEDEVYIYDDDTTSFRLIGENVKSEEITWKDYTMKFKDRVLTVILKELEPEAA